MPVLLYTYQTHQPTETKLLLALLNTEILGHCLNTAILLAIVGVFPDWKFHRIGKDVGIGNIGYLFERLIFPSHPNSRLAIYQEIPLSV